MFPVDLEDINTREPAPPPRPLTRITQTLSQTVVVETTPNEHAR
jgi:hypothetical protein